MAARLALCPLLMVLMMIRGLAIRPESTRSARAGPSGALNSHDLVPEVGIEPTRSCDHGILSRFGVLVE